MARNREGYMRIPKLMMDRAKEKGSAIFVVGCDGAGDTKSRIGRWELCGYLDAETAGNLFRFGAALQRKASPQEAFSEAFEAKVTGAADVPS